MTILELIRKLHEEGTVVLDYEIYTTNDVIGIEDAIYRWNVNPSVLRDASQNVYPGSFDLGETPEYLVCRDADEYEEYTGVELRKAMYPRLLVCVSKETMVEFSKRWKGHHWSEIPPVEVYWTQVSFCHAIPLLSGDGVFIGYENTFPGDRKGSYYLLKDKHGYHVAWAGNLIKDRLPDDMTVEDAGKYF